VAASGVAVSPLHPRIRASWDDLPRIARRGSICPDSDGERREVRRQQRLRTEATVGALIPAPGARLVALRTDLPQRESQRRLLAVLLSSRIFSSDPTKCAAIPPVTKYGTRRKEHCVEGTSRKYCLFIKNDW